MDELRGQMCPLCQRHYWSNECPHDIEQMEWDIKNLHTQLDIVHKFIDKFYATNLPAPVWVGELVATLDKALKEGKNG